MYKTQKQLSRQRALYKTLIFLAIAALSVAFVLLTACAHEPSQRAIEAKQRREARAKQQDSIARIMWAEEQSLAEDYGPEEETTPQAIIIEATLYNEGDETGWVKYRFVSETGETDKHIFANQFPVTCIEQVMKELMYRGKHSDFWNEIEGWNWIIVDPKGCLSMAIER